MISFVNDYSEGAHPQIMDMLVKTNLEQTPGYSEDAYCAEARERIKRVIDHPGSEVHFLVGGTLTNLTVISAALRTHQGAIAAVTGHISVHETGAIEATGHKVLTLPSPDGKINAAQVDAMVKAHFADESFEHMVQPGLVYISQPSEVGTVYTLAELKAMREVCNKWNLYLYADGARMACALTAPGNDVTLHDLAELADAYTIGGAKMGALFGEAVVINNPVLNRDFRYIMKQKGGMFSKGRLLGIQFNEFFRDSLYFDLGVHANKLAEKLRAGFISHGFTFAYPSTTNQSFPILPNELLEKIEKKYSFSHWAGYDDTSSVVRFCTSWATPESSVDEFLADLDRWA